MPSIKKYQALVINNDWADAIDKALDDLMVKGGTLYFPKDVYTVSRGITKTPLSELKISGGQATIRLSLPSGQANIQSVLRFNDVRKNITFEGITIDCNRQAANPLFIHNYSDDMTKVCTVTFSECLFENGLQTDSTYYFSGVYVRGAFARVIANRTIFRNMDSIRAVPISRGLQVSEDSDKDNYTREVIVSDCVIEDIYNPTTIDSDGVFHSAKFSETGLNPCTLTVKGSTFRNCKGRSIKSQVQGNVITNSNFYRDKYNGNYEIDCQYAGAVMNNNQFYYLNFGVGVILGGSVRSNLHNQFSISDNIITVTNATIGVVCGIDTKEKYPVNSISIRDNKVRGKVDYFCSLRIADIPDNRATIEGNSANTAKGFARLWMWGTGSPVLHGSFKSNTELGVSKPIVMESCKYKPSQYLDNLRITVPDNSLYVGKEDQTPVQDIIRVGGYTRQVIQGASAMNKELSINIPWENRRSAFKVTCATAYASDTEVATRISTLECWVSMGMNGVVKTSPIVNESSTLGSWDIVANSDLTGIRVTKSIGSNNATCNYFIVIEGSNNLS